MNTKEIKGISPFILFLPFLLIYVFCVLYFHTDRMDGDEARYIQFAQNLLHGFYSPAYPDINLINGPGYPIILMPFVALDMPLISITLFNALLHYLSVILLYKSIFILIDSYKYALLVAVCWGSYFLAWQEMPCILTETVTLFLIALFSYQVLSLFKEHVFFYRPIVLAGITLGFLILTKVIFAYALLCVLAISIFFYTLNTRDIAYKKIMFISIAACIVISPYLFYTYRLTSNVFYLSSEGGKVLYWMTSPSQDEYGDWNNSFYTANCIDTTAFCNSDFIRKNHEADIEQINNTKTVLESDSLFKAMAIRNIKAHPVKYLKNWFSNIGRLLFGFPASYYFQNPKTLIRIYINSFLVIGMLYSFVLTLLNWKNIPLQIRFLVVLVFIYLFESSLVSAYPRQFYVVVPILLIWITYILKNTLKINLSVQLPDKP